MAVDAQGNEIIETTQTTQTQVPPDTRSNERITELSDKVKTTAQERDSEKAAREAAERRAAFAEGFADIVATNPSAKDHKDEIKQKVLESNYSVEDATFAVLGKAGKLGAAQQTQQTQVAGGSAATAMPQGGQKSPAEMSQAERREQLAKDLLWQ
jgi:hypothetical protein